MRRGLNFLLGAAMLAPVVAEAQPVDYVALDMTRYHSFVGAWSPQTAPLCALISSQAKWDAVMHPAPVMGGGQVFGPPADTWGAHSVLLLARIVPGGGGAPALRPVFAKLNDGVLEVDYQFRTPPQSSYTVSTAMALEIPEVVPDSVVFKENGKTVCTLAPAKGVWLSPAPPKP